MLLPLHQLKGRHHLRELQLYLFQLLLELQLLISLRGRSFLNNQPLFVLPFELLPVLPFVVELLFQVADLFFQLGDLLGGL
mmetsp:Transcript_9917/g.9807  ORF Transcript_9917/g.9807 Transcript_9917/m.9807 type:complete len:81 (+) Transcript_9917:1197-1439(+)